MSSYSIAKLRRLSTIAKITTKLKQDGKKIVLCHGVFDLIHPGHIRYLRSAKNHGHILVVTITADKFVNKGPGRPIFRQELRAEFLSSIDLVDYIAIVNSSSALDGITAIKPDYFIVGSDNKNTRQHLKDNEAFAKEIQAVESGGGKVVYTEDNIVFSSTKLIGDYLDVYPPKTRKYLNDFKSKYSAEVILDQLQKIRKQKILIIGDTIIDQYFYCLPLGKSSKEPVMVHQYISHESYIGGVLATANHIASLADNITLISLLGKKQSFKSMILKKLRSSVKPVFFYQTSDSTIIKRRFLDVNNKQKLFQISYLRDDFVLPEKTENEVLKFIKQEIPKYDLVIVNDFGHGLLTKKMISVICKKARYLALNVQANSANFGYNLIFKYPKADFICIDNQEIRLATHDKFSQLQPLIRKIYQKMKCSFIIVTQGSRGSLSYSTKSGFISSPALSDRIVDRVGAGDAFFAITSPCVFIGMSPELVSFLGNVAGALKVQIVGNKKQIELDDLVKFINRLLN